MMTLFTNRTKEEQNIIRKAYEFEIWAIKKDCANTNPWFKACKAMGIWEAVNEAVEMYYR